MREVGADPQWSLDPRTPAHLASLRSVSGAALPQTQSGMAETSRDRRAAHIPQPVTARTATAHRSETHKAQHRGYGGREPP